MKARRPVPVPISKTDVVSCGSGVQAPNKVPSVPIFMPLLAWSKANC